MAEDNRGIYLLFGAAGLSAVGWWLATRKAKAATAGSSCLPAATGLCLSGDCSTVEYDESRFRTGLIAQYVLDRVNSKNEYPIYGIVYPNSDPTILDHSLDRLVRDVVEEFFPKNCYKGAFWLDLYLRENPVPRPASGSRTQYYDALFSFSQQVRQAVQQNSVSKAASEAANTVGRLVAEAYLYRFDLSDVNYTAEQVKADPEVREIFRTHFDSFMSYLSGGDWEARDMLLPRASNLTQADQNALAFAANTAALSGVSWPAIVASTGYLPIIRSATVA